MYRGVAKQDHEDNVPIDLCTTFLVIDVAQSRATTLLQGDQMGDFYCMSPLIHSIFGVAYPAENHMNVYIGRRVLSAEMLTTSSPAFTMTWSFAR